MKFFKSIKWRLQLWYGLILVAVLVGFGVTAYQLERNRVFRRVDDEIRRRVDLLGRALHGPPPRRDSDGPNSIRPPLGPFPDGPSEPNFGPPQKFHLPPETAELFDAGDPYGFFFSISRNGSGIAGSTNCPDDFKLPRASDERIPVSPRREYREMVVFVSLRGTYREMVCFMPSGEWIRVGRNIAPELKELHFIAVTLTSVGAAILILGLAGGWWFVGRAMKPISEISATATKISAGDLSQRINSAETESELGQLVAVLNSTFARLEKAFAQQKQFASDAAHELRTPVSVILTQTQTALNRERDAAAYKQTVEACQRAAQRMRRLIESLLALARFDAGQEMLNRLNFDLARIITDSAELVQPLADERGVKIISAVSPLEITGDPERLAQVVTNLLTNAIQYNRPEGEVRVKLELQPGLAILTIADTGQGIAPEDLPHVFQRFYRADQSRTGGGNAGLGLSICKAIVEAHGGMIEVTSEVNAGTAFCIRLPLEMAVSAVKKRG